MGRRNRRHRRATAVRILKAEQEQADIEAYRLCGAACDPEGAEQVRRDRINEARGRNAAPYDEALARFRAGR